MRSRFAAAPSVVSSADSARGLGCVPGSWRTCSAAVACGTCDRSVSPIGGTMGPLMRTLTRLVERGRGCPRSTHGAHAPLMGPAYHDPSTSSPTSTKPTPIPCQARPTRIGYAFADRLLTYPHASNLSVSRLPALRIVGCGRWCSKRPGDRGQCRGTTTEHRSSPWAPHLPKLARNSGARTFCSTPKTLQFQRCDFNV